MTNKTTSIPKKSFSRRGASAVEVALCLPIFILFLAALMEFGHVFMVSHLLKTAAQTGARFGSTEGATSAQVTAKVQQIVSAAFPSTNATVIVRDAGIFDTADVNPSNINYNSLPSITLPNATDGQLFIVQVTVPYDQVALLPPIWVKGRTVTGQSVMRHE
jgi:Flp pilus assembly protein TadG